MTLIAYTITSGIPIMIGDILLTSVGHDLPKNLFLPAIMQGIENIFDDVELKPLMVNQKLCIINDHLCIGAAGNVGNIVSLVRALRSYYSDSIPTNDELSHFLNQYPKEKKDKISAFVLLVEENDAQLVTMYRHAIGVLDSMSHPLFNQINSIGTGSLQYQKFIKDLSIEPPKLTEKGPTSEPNKFRNALQQNLQLISRMIGFESTTAQNLRDAWGVGYEVIMFDRVFRKLDDITILVANTKFDPITKTVEVKGLSSLMKYQYHRGLLVISSVGSGKVHLFPIPEIDKDLNMDLMDDFPKVIDFNSVTTILYYTVELPDQTYDSGQAVFLRQGVDASFPRNVTIMNNDGQFTFTFSPLLLNAITESAKERFFA